MESSGRSIDFRFANTGPSSGEEVENRIFLLQDLEDIRARVDSRIQEAQLTIANAETEVTQADESLIVRQSIADIF